MSQVRSRSKFEYGKKFENEVGIDNGLGRCRRLSKKFKESAHSLKTYSASGTSGCPL
jgi:hypothetical protein